MKSQKLRHDLNSRVTLPAFEFGISAHADAVAWANRRRRLYSPSVRRGPHHTLVFNPAAAIHLKRRPAPGPALSAEQLPFEVDQPGVTRPAPRQHRRGDFSLVPAYPAAHPKPRARRAGPQAGTRNGAADGYSVRPWASERVRSRLLAPPSRCRRWPDPNLLSVASKTPPQSL